MLYLPVNASVRLDSQYFGPCRGGAGGFVVFFMCLFVARPLDDSCEIVCRFAGDRFVGTCRERSGIGSV